MKSFAVKFSAANSSIEPTLVKRAIEVAVSAAETTSRLPVFTVVL